MKLLITFKVKESYKNIIKNILSPYVELLYLDENDHTNRHDLLSKVDIIFAWNISKELKTEDYTNLKKCKFIQLLSAGANHIPFKCVSENIIIASNVGAYAKPMAEHVISLLFALSKSLLERHNELKNKLFNQYKLNKLIEGSTCGILGFGGIGKAVVNLLRPFQVKIFAINTTGKTDLQIDFIGTLKDLDYVLKNVDFLVITLPLNKYTYNLIDTNKLNIMKKDAILVNVARGDILVEKDFYIFLKNNPEFKAGIDAWWIEPFSHGFFKTNFPFFDLPNFLGSPHNSAIVPGVIEEALVKASENILNFINNKYIKGIVNREDYDFNF
jgi:glycerate dehydrogenase